MYVYSILYFLSLELICSETLTLDWLFEIMSKNDYEIEKITDYNVKTVSI